MRGKTIDSPGRTIQKVLSYFFNVKIRSPRSKKLLFPKLCLRVFPWIIRDRVQDMDIINDISKTAKARANKKHRYRKVGLL